MHVSIGYSENPDTTLAGLQAAQTALRAGISTQPCLMVLLFSTARHDPAVLRQAVASVFGPEVMVVGGGAIGVISNDRLGYAGDQVGLAAFWMKANTVDLLVQGDVPQNEDATGEALGKRLSALGVTPASPVLFFYDAVDRARCGLQPVMVTPMLEGMKRTLGYYPALCGAGLQGDFICTPTKQWTGDGISSGNALALVFSNGVQIDTTIIHGCWPATGYYTVTRADRQTILEIDGVPALTFMNSLLGEAIPPEEYAFFLMLGVNKGDPWADFNENSYVNRLCLTIDRERNGLVMFEPDMVEGTRFQIMHRSMDLNYIPPKVEGLFNRLNGRKPVFAFYIDCAGRAAAYAGIDQEDGQTVREIVGDRVPLLGIYSGVEIASVEGLPRGLDWTGVFCLFSVET
ncbi:FIST C-terminal domain-containing protein [Phaeovibrio sulfidiphilus]|uniref:FIST C-terminal domain-containing protein n=1 Tax=Phaeovibrio sulfidiphilus TaxID=1220600 RepID=A0A8J7CQ63_9PROT|nr:FIST N-terminal domain-containing protein [Phaeovibrio sulfidiphilus]MBE1236510.1 FIST C-terminal domain-containing protein [Phaeovibrio sulfidiphilus]